MNVCDTNHQISIATITKIPSYPFFLSASPTRDYLTQNKPTTLWNEYTQEELKEKFPMFPSEQIPAAPAPTSSWAAILTENSPGLFSSLDSPIAICFWALPPVLHIVFLWHWMWSSNCCLPPPSWNCQRFSELQVSHFSFYSFLIFSQVLKMSVLMPGLLNWPQAYFCVL